jgi:hypothetical protein
MARKGERKPICKYGHARVPENLTAQGACRLCAYDYRMKWNRENKGRVLELGRKSRLKVRYKMDEVKYQSMLFEQEDKCAICGNPFTEDLKGKPHVDHSHACCPSERSCGKCVRALLCHKCNIVIAYANDNPRVLAEAILYLNKHKEKDSECQLQNMSSDGMVTAPMDLGKK